MADRAFYSNRYSRKRGSFDSHKPNPDSHKPNPDSHKPSKHKDTRKEVAELSIDLNPKKHLLSLHGRNHTHRIQQEDMCELREEVEQLRMQNQSLKEELRQMRKNEEDLKYEAMRAREEVYSKMQKYATLESQYALLEEKASKYAKKIKDLFEGLINEKKKNSLIPDSLASRTRATASPCSHSNSVHFRNLEKEGEQDYYYSLAHPTRNEVLEGAKLAWSIENSHNSPMRVSRQAHTRQTFGTIF